MSQTTYSNAFSAPFAGTLGDTGPSRKGAWVNDEGSAIPAGIAVARKSESNGAKKAELPDSAASKIVGFVLNSFARNPDEVTGSNAIENGAAMNVLEEGTIWVTTEQAMAITDDVYIRITSDGGSNTQLGSIRKDADSSRAMLCKGARILRGSSGAGAAALLHFSASAQNAADKADAGAYQVSLTAAAEAANSITVTGQVKDMNGANVTSAANVLFWSLAVTDGAGDLSDGGDGTLKKASNPAAGANVAWMETTAGGSFQVAVANTNAEETLVWASVNGGPVSLLKLTFA